VKIESAENQILSPGYDHPFPKIHLKSANFPGMETSYNQHVYSESVVGRDSHAGVGTVFPSKSAAIL
jgi:hypothetical protein